jgi:hypothetical protein
MRTRSLCWNKKDRRCGCLQMKSLLAEKMEMQSPTQNMHLYFQQSACPYGIKPAIDGTPQEPMCRLSPTTIILEVFVTSRHPSPSTLKAIGASVFAERTERHQQGRHRPKDQEVWARSLPDYFNVIDFRPAIWGFALDINCFEDKVSTFPLFIFPYWCSSENCVDLYRLVLCFSDLFQPSHFDDWYNILNEFQERF